MIAWSLAFAFVLAVDARPAGAIGLDPDNAVYDFGRISPWERVTHTFRLYNHLQEPVAVSEVVTSCNCTAASLEANTIAPGESTKIRVTVDPHDLDGPIERSVEVRNADILLARLTVTATVVKPLSVSRTEIRFDDLDPTSVRSESVALTPLPGDEPVVVKSIEAPPAIAAAVIADQVRLSLDPRLLERAPSGVLEVVVDTDRGRVPLHVLWRWHSHIRVDPERIVIVGDGPSATTITLARADGLPFRVTRASATDRRVAVATVKQHGAAVIVAVRVPRIRGLRINDTLTIVTDQPQQPEIRVPVLVLVP